LDGSLRSVTSHLAFMSDFILLIRFIVVTKRRRSSTQTVMMVNSLPMQNMYAHGLECRHA
jgi:hypothetical protein